MPGDRERRPRWTHERLRRLRELVARALGGPRRIAWLDRSLGATLDYVLDCRTVRRALSSHHDDQLPRWKARLVRAHVSTCAICGPIDESLRHTISALRELRDEPAQTENTARNA